MRCLMRFCPMVETTFCANIGLYSSTSIILGWVLTRLMRAEIWNDANLNPGPKSRRALWRWPLAKRLRIWLSKSASWLMSRPVRYCRVGRLRSPKDALPMSGRMRLTALGLLLSAWMVGAVPDPRSVRRAYAYRKWHADPGRICLSSHSAWHHHNVYRSP